MGVAVVAATPTAAFKVLSNICNNFMASGPSLEGSVPKAANGENNEDIAAACFDEGVAGTVEGVTGGPGPATPAAEEFTPGVEGGVAFGMKNPGCSIANKLCCCAGVIAIGFMVANAARDWAFVMGVALGFGGLGVGVAGSG